MIRAYDLSGEWKFSFHAPVLDDSIRLPGTTAQAGKGERNSKRETEHLTEVYPFEGKAFYGKTVLLQKEDAGRDVRLVLERTRMTRVWVNGQCVGSCDSLCTPHVYDLTPYIKEERFELLIQVENTGYPTRGGHLTSPDTQTNWNGITGRMALEVFDGISIRSVTARSDEEKKTVSFLLEMENQGVETVRTLTFRPDEERLGENGAAVKTPGKQFPEGREEIRLPHGKSLQEVSYRFREEPVLWSEYSPVVYRFHFGIEGTEEKAETVTGLRSFRAQGHDFLINGRAVKLRGKHEGMLFPLTGAAPTDTGEWLRVMEIAKSYGINHYRFHTCCPPDAAFRAADLLGIYMEPELPFWGTITQEGEEGHRGEEQEYLIREGMRILETYGNHPSFCMLSMGNELWGSPKRIGEIMDRLKNYDNRPLYTQGSNNFQFTPQILPQEDFFVGVRLGGSDGKGRNERLLRGSYAMCDAPQGHIQTEEPSARHCYDEAVLPPKLFVQQKEERLAGKEEDGPENDRKNGGEMIEIQYGTGVKRVKASGDGGGLLPQIPVVTHEIGQFATFPDFKEIEKYTGVTRAENLKIFRERLAEKGMADQAEEFFLNSGKLAVQCYKEELEAAHRSRYVAGYQILDIQDFQGQGTALVGILDAFMDSKGLVSAREWRSFCSDEVLLAEFDKYNYEEQELFRADVAVSYFNQARELSGKTVEWEVLSGQEILHQGRLPIPDGTYGLAGLGEISFSCPQVKKAECLTLRLWAEGTALNKEYPVWVYPRNAEVRLPEEGPAGEEPFVWVTGSCGQAATWLGEGKRVLLFPEKLAKGIKGAYCTDFWNYPMFRKISEQMKKPVPVGTMGLVVRREHPALKDFATETWTTPQWYALCADCECAILDDIPLRPLVQMIDNFERNHRLGLLFEARVGEGRLLMCTGRAPEHMDRPEVRQLVKGLLEYAASEKFEPKDSLSEEELAELCGM